MDVVGTVDPVPEEVVHAAYPPVASSPSRARQLVHDVLRSHGRDDLITDATLLVSELATNAVVHAQDEFLIIVMLDERSVRVEVHDADEAVPVEVPYDPETPGGQGIRIVNTIADRWGVDRLPSGEKTVWFELSGPS